MRRDLGYTGPQEKANEVFAPVAQFGPPALHGVHSMPFPALQSAFDGLYPPGHQWYWRADFVDELSDEAIALHARHGAELPTMQSAMHLYPIDGAPHDFVPARYRFQLPQRELGRSHDRRRSGSEERFNHQ